MADLNTGSLVVSKFASNSCYVRVEDKIPKGITVDVKARTWRYDPPRDGYYGDNRNGWPIGESRYFQPGIGKSEDVIGIYDRMDTAQLSSMVHDAIEATRDHSSCEED